MKLVALAIAVALLLPSFAYAQQPTYQSLKADAERAYAEGSYARALQLYTQASKLAPSIEETWWTDFRIADTSWRAAAGDQSSDTTKLDEARKKLEELISDVERAEDRDRIWVEVQESLGDFYWTRRDSRNWGQAWPYYQNALAWWAAARDVELARTRYVALVWKMTEPPGRNEYEYYGYYGYVVPIDVIENVSRIAKTPNDQAHAHYLLAVTLMRQGGDEVDRVPAEFEAAIAPGKSVDWYDDALYQYAQFLSSYGRMAQNDDGTYRRDVDYAGALALYRRLTTEFRKGETRYYDDAAQQVANITKPSLTVSVPNVFLPGSEIRYQLAWRNVSRVDLAIYPVDLTTDVALSKEQPSAGDWLSQVNVGVKPPLKAWSKDTEDRGDHVPGQDEATLDIPLPVGAYVLEAKAGNETSRELVLVTDASVVVRSSPRHAVVYVCDAANGAPIPKARVVLWQSVYANDKWTWRQVPGTTGSDGVLPVDLSTDGYSGEIFVAASIGARQAFAIANRYGYTAPGRDWRVYAFTDRPAYRPGEKAQWKLVARIQDDGAYTTPANAKVEYQIDDPRGAKVAEGTSALNDFGSAWGSLDLTADMPLGEYNVTFWTEGKKESIGSATLFRVEEYKLPEFKVSIHTPEENGRKKAFRAGDRVDVDVQAEYYFGGPVADATVEVQVYQNPYYRVWWRPRDYPWLYAEADDSSRRYYGQGPVVKREVLKTDGEGKARVSFDTPRYQGQDFEYRIEARVTDSSRREIVASDSVRVTRQRYYVNLQPDRYLVKPGDQSTVSVRALDANDQPLAVDGKMTVTREVYTEVWQDPNGKTIAGEDLRKAREKNKVFPPATQPGKPGWKLIKQDYEKAVVLTQDVKTDAEGKADFTFTPDVDGYYRVAWTSPDKGAQPVRAETTVWAATNAMTEIGYRTGGLEIVVDKDTFRAGETARVMIAAPRADRWVLFGVDGEDVYNYQLVHLTGTVKLVDLPITDQFVPNVYLDAAMVSDNQMFVDTKEVVVPPVKNFLTVDVKPDRDLYEPRDEGTLTVTTKDADGKPVAAEVALGFVDDSVYYIQKDYAPDPRQFFFGERRSQQVVTQSSFQQKSYARLVREIAAEKPGGRVAIEGSHVAEMGANNGTIVTESSARAAMRDGAPAAAPVAGQAGIVAKSAGELDRLADKKAEAPNEAGAEPAVVVRSDFRSTVIWQPDVVTDASGTAVVKVALPDSLTSWRATARAATTGSQFGVATATARTRRPLTARLQAPRFFLAGDTATVSAVLNNNTNQPVAASTTIEIEGLELQGSTAAAETVVPPGGEKRVDWTVSVKQPGTAKIKITSRGGKYADAMERTYTVYEHGVDKLVAASGKSREDDTTVTLDIPAERKKGSESLVVQVSPSIAVTMIDALPYLVDYPYGCTEQTMSRFLPATIVADVLADLGLDPKQVEGRAFGGIEPSTVAATHPEKTPGLGALAKAQRAGLDRLYDFQHADGGWGWWKEGDSDHYMTAYVVWGLTLAKDAGVDVRGDALSRGVDYLRKEVVEEETNRDLQTWMLHALAAYAAQTKATPADAERKAFDNVYEKRDGLSAYGRALLALAAHDYGLSEQAGVLVRSLDNGVKVDNAPEASALEQTASSGQRSAVATAHWGEESNWWRWSEGAIESTSFALQAMLAIDPKNELVEPAMNWLVKNRRGAQWTNTRDTAYAVLALADYLKATGEVAKDLDYEVFVNGTSIGTKQIRAADAIAAPSRFTVDPSAIRDGANEVRIVRRGGDAPIYFAAEARFFSLEEPVTAAGHELFVKRQYFKLVGHPTLLTGYVYDRIPLGDGESVKSGERIETVLTIETKNDYEYLVFEDLKPAGFEAVEVRSGSNVFAKELKSGAVEGDRRGDPTDYTDRQRWVYQELRDRKVALFVDKMPQGVWELRYEMRAETPGAFHALPVLGHAMYVPEIRGNGAEIRVKVVE